MTASLRQRDLYPPIEASESGRLAVGDGHDLHWETAGNPKGKAVVFLHGGPGAGCSPDHRRFFDPAAWRIVLFDQRGAGRSTPAGSLANNTTQALVADIEALRRHLEIERWAVFGGSWGSTLALAYAETHPEAVSALVLRGIFLARPAEIDWFLFGMGQFFPEEHDRFLAALTETERDDPLANYYRRLTDPDPEVHLPAARAWSRYEGACSTLLPSPETVNAFGRDRLALPLARLEAHYFAHRCFLEEGQLLQGVGRLREAGIPGSIVQGRYDVICPPQSAWDLYAAWPEARLSMIPDAGHSAMEPGVRRALVAATDALR
jgi:proline iminopeptidase